MAVVDIHCHVFNADDLPVRGFLEHLYLETPVLGSLLSALVGRIVQGRAPGYADDMARIQRLLTMGRGTEDVAMFGLPAALVPAGGPTLDERADAIFAELAAEDPVFLHRLGAAAAAASGDPTATEPIGTAGLGDRLTDARRMIRWAAIFAMSRIDVARELVANFGGEVDLFCPLLVDLGPGLGDRPKTTMAQQVDLLEGIAILSMRGQLPGVSKGRLHPFVGFDPRAQLRAELAGSARMPLDVVREAVQRRGFIGVKLYPPDGMAAARQPGDHRHDRV